MTGWVNLLEMDVPKEFNSKCSCGHEKSEHIYEEGACRPGFICECEKYEPMKAAYFVNPPLGEYKIETPPRTSLGIEISLILRKLRRFFK